CQQNLVLRHRVSECRRNSDQRVRIFLCPLQFEIFVLCFLLVVLIGRRLNHGDEQLPSCLFAECVPPLFRVCSSQNAETFVPVQDINQGVDVTIRQRRNDVLVNLEIPVTTNS